MNNERLNCVRKYTKEFFLKSHSQILIRVTTDTSNELFEKGYLFFDRLAHVFVKNLRIKSKFF